MPTALAKPATMPIPVQLSAAEFTAFILPHLPMPGGVPIMGASYPPRTNRLTKKLSSEARGCVWAAEMDDKSYSAATRVLMLVFFVPRQKTL